MKYTTLLLMAFSMASAGCAREAPGGLAYLAPSAPYAKAVGGRLLYVSNSAGQNVSVFSYPGESHRRSLQGFSQPQGECVDTAGDVFITEFYNSRVLEYRHGGNRRIETIVEENERPAGCSVDPVSGDLAVNNYYTASNGMGSIALYAKSGGGWSYPPTLYHDSHLSIMSYCGYDNKGDLYVDGLSDSSGDFGLAVLPFGHQTFTDLKLHQQIAGPGDVMWDGRSMTLADAGSSPTAVYRFVVHGTGAQITGTTRLTGTSVAQYWIEGDRIVGAQPYANSVGVWEYPSGKSFGVMTLGLRYPLGVAISN